MTFGDLRYSLSVVEDSLRRARIADARLTPFRDGFHRTNDRVPDEYLNRCRARWRALDGRMVTCVFGVSEPILAERPGAVAEWMTHYLRHMEGRTMETA